MSCFLLYMLTYNDVGESGDIEIMIICLSDFTQDMSKTY